jgi:hypothetical protein
VGEEEGGAPSCAGAADGEEEALPDEGVDAGAGAVLPPDAPLPPPPPSVPSGLETILCFPKNLLMGQYAHFEALHASLHAGEVLALPQ